MNIVWFSWKDRSHPLAGGAETVSGHIMDRLAKNGHHVRHITALYPGAKPHETIDNIEIFRTGNRYTVYTNAKSLYLREMNDWEDMVIDEMNTFPFAAATYTHGPTKLLLAYQLAREIWFYQIFFPASVVGYILEPFMLRWIAPKYPFALTESKSSQIDLRRHGFKDVRIFKVGMALKPLTRLAEKNSRSVLILGNIRPMKRTLHAVKAFETARDNDPSLSLIVAGSANSAYGKKVTRYINNSRHSNAITVKGFVTSEERLSLMREAAVILVTSVKEGWGLIVTEANSQGTPAIAYDTDGLRDSVRDGETGLLAEQGKPKDMGKKIIELLSDPKRYNTMRETGWRWSKEFTFENSYADFAKEIGLD